MIDAQIEPLLYELGLGAAKLGYELYIVGGYVRDKLFAEQNSFPISDFKDIDLVINTDAIEFVYQMQKFLEDNSPNHVTFDIVQKFEQFKTIKISHENYPGYEIEFASTRIETYSEPAAFPKVQLIESISEDLPRRDFTINALLVSLAPKDFAAIHDHCSAIEDFKNKLIRVFHKDSFIDDPTRVYRALRFMAKLDFELESQTEELLLAAVKHPEWSNWQERRKSRFEIEADFIFKLNAVQKQRIADFTAKHKTLEELLL